MEQTLVRAAEYVRKSTDHQEYSTVIQSVTNHAYAASRGMEIVRTYADEGKSGLKVDGRTAFKQLIDDVKSGRADFKAVLVNDVNRWGRFQDTDESAYYEYICKRSGVAVHYCAEQFENDGSPFAAIVKGIKRAMAGEYSRELSVKVFAGHARLFGQGFRQGAAPGFGMRRLLVDQDGAPKCVLAAGERKSIQTDRVVLIPGPLEELKIVRWIFSTFVNKRKSGRAIMRMLNKESITTGLGRPWTYSRVNRILQNEAFIGNHVWNRTSIRLGSKLVRNRPEARRTKYNFKPVVHPSLFEAAQNIIRARIGRLSDEEMLAPLRRLLRIHRFLSSVLINDCAEAPCVTSLVKRFGGLGEVYKLVGFTGSRTHVLSNDQLLVLLRKLLKKHGRLSEAIIDRGKRMPAASTYQQRFGRLSQAYELVGYKPRRYSHQGLWEATHNRSNEQFLEVLRQVLEKRGHLSSKIINGSKGVPSAHSYKVRFGSLPQAYELIGYTQKRLPSRRKQRRRSPLAR